LRILNTIRRHKSDATTATFALIAAFFVLFLISLGYFTYQARDDAKRRGQERAFAASQVVELNARSYVDIATQALKRIDSALGRRIAGRVTRSELRDLDQAIDGLPTYVQAFVVNADGETLFSTDEMTKEADFTGREFFVSAVADNKLHISALTTNPATGEPIFTISQRIEREGKFAGASALSFEVRQLINVANSLEFDDQSVVSLIRSDGQLIARHPPADGAADQSNSALFRQKDTQAGTYQAKSVNDGISRIVGYRLVPGTNMYAVAAISTETAMAPFWRNAAVTYAFALPAGVGLAVASFWIVGLMTRERRRQAELERTLEVNRLLFRDTHHRVKNNLQSVQSLVRMQAIPAAAKMDLQRRIAAMTAVHEHIYRADTYVDVGASEFVPAIIDPLLKSFDAKVAVEYDIDPVTIDREHSTALALLLNEVVTNALKYAFEGRTDGRLSISLLSLNDERVRLRIRDNGPGFDIDEAGKGMGTKLIAGMIQQMDGHFEYRRDNGTIFSAEFPGKTVPDPARRKASEIVASAAE
jgi:two-component sensor histidine kinase